MLAEQKAGAWSGASLPVGELVTLVIDDERFFGWVASASPVSRALLSSLNRGSQRVQECIPVENIQRLRVLHAHPELRKAQEQGAPLRTG